MNEVLSVQVARAVQTAERDVDLHVVRAADCAESRSTEPAPVIRWIDPCTGRVWGSPNSRQLVDLALQAAQDEQEERAKHLTREEAWRCRERILEL